jgi:hypothetical protein
MKVNIPDLDLEKMNKTENPSRLDILAQTDRKKIEILKKKKKDLELASCTFMPNATRTEVASSSRTTYKGVSRDFVQKMSKPKTMEKYAKIKQEKETIGCTFMPKVNKPRRAKTHRAKQPIKEQETTHKKVDVVIADKPVELVEKWEPKKDEAKEITKVVNPESKPNNSESGPKEPDVKPFGPRIPESTVPDSPAKKTIESETKKRDALSRTNSLYTNHLV